MYVRVVHIMRLVAGILTSYIYRSDTCLCTVGNVYGSLDSGSESVPVQSQGKYSSGWHVQSRLAERGANGGLRHSLLALCQCVP